MKYATDHAFRTALEARISQGQSDSAGVSRVRKRIVFERLLARLVAQAPGEWVLKGGFALELRLGNIARSTKDADFEWRLDEEDAVEELLDAAALDIGDRFTFALERRRGDGPSGRRAAMAGRGDARGQDLRAHGGRRRVRGAAGPGTRPDHDVRPARVRIVAVVCVIDREAGGAANLAAQGLELRSVFRMSRLAAA